MTLVWALGIYACPHTQQTLGVTEAAEMSQAKPHTQEAQDSVSVMGTGGEWEFFKTGAWFPAEPVGAGWNAGIGAGREMTYGKGRMLETFQTVRDHLFLRAAEVVLCSHGEYSG